MTFYLQNKDIFSIISEQRVLYITKLKIEISVSNLYPLIKVRVKIHFIDMNINVMPFGKLEPHIFCKYNVESWTENHVGTMKGGDEKFQSMPNRNNTLLY